MIKIFFNIFFVFAFSTVTTNVFAETEEEARARIMKEYNVQDSTEEKVENGQAVQAQPQDNSKKIDSTPAEDLESQIQSTVNDLQNMGFDKKDEDKPAVGDGEIKSSYLSGMMNNMMKNMISSFLKENPFSKMNRNEVKSMITVRLEGFPVGKFFENNPRVLDMLVDWIRHPYALPKIMGIVNKPDKVKIYGGVVVAIFIISFFLNLFNSKGNLLKRIFTKMCIFTGAFILNMGTFIFLFKENLNPTFDVIFKYFHL